MWSPEVIGDLYRQHRYAVFRRCRSLLGDEHEAQEMVHEVFLQLLEHPGRFARRSSVSTYLYAIATHRCLNRLRDRSARGAAWRARVADHIARQARDDRPDAALAARQIVGLVLEAADPTSAAIALYHFVDGLSQGDIAGLVGLSRVSVNKRIGRLRRHARALTAEACP